MSLLLPFVKSRPQNSPALEKKEPLQSFCDNCALRFTEEKRKNAMTAVNPCGHQSTDNEASSMSAAFWQSLLYSYSDPKK